MNQDLQGRIAIVTGASAGIGEATARELASRGCRVVLNARREDRLRALASELPKGAAAIVAGDCADARVVEALAQACVKNFGGEADLLVANAGRGLGGTAITSDAGQWDEMIRTNILGVSRQIRAIAPRMLAKFAEGDVTLRGAWTKSPRDIIILGSVVGRHVSPFSSFYSCTKAAVQTLAEGTRRELGPKGLRVTLVEPGFVTSEFQGVAGYKPEWYAQTVEKLGPVLEPADIARAIAYIASQPAHVHVSDILIRPTRQDYP
jgi:NADP-dependent 3-hydroxy acid dehydrogenase YdfG